MTPDPTPRPGFPVIAHGSAGRPAFPAFTGADEPEVDPGDARAEARRAIEAVVLAATEPVPARDLAELVECSVDVVAAICRELAEEYERDERGFVLAEVAGGYRYQTHPAVATYVEQFVLEGQHVRMSAPALETLATLEQRGYVQEVGRDPGPGLASFYGTTARFLERLGLASLADLPSLGDFVPGPEVVEALERGLRADQDPRLDAPPVEAAAGDAAPEVGAGDDAG